MTTVRQLIEDLEEMEQLTGGAAVVLVVPMARTANGYVDAPCVELSGVAAAHDPNHGGETVLLTILPASVLKMAGTIRARLARAN
jgi:hypothetical protein